MYLRKKIIGILILLPQFFSNSSDNGPDFYRVLNFVKAFSIDVSWSPNLHQQQHNNSHRGNDKYSNVSYTQQYTYSIYGSGLLLWDHSALDQYHPLAEG